MLKEGTLIKLDAFSTIKIELVTKDIKIGGFRVRELIDSQFEGDIMYFYAPDEILVCTPEQWINVANYGFMQAWEVTEGDQFVHLTGISEVISKIENKYFKGKVYNIDIDKLIYNANGYIIHN